MSDDPPEGAAMMSACHGGESDATGSGSAGEDTLVAQMIRAAETFPDEPSFTFLDFATDPAGRRTTLSWSELDRRTGAMAAILAEAGAAPGERVAVVAPQGPEYVVGFLGAMRAGAIAVPLFPPNLPGHDEKLASVLADTRPAVLLTTEPARVSLEDFRISKRLPGRSGVVAVGLAELESRAADLPGPPEVRVRPEDCAYLQYTSGSTRNPSGVEVTHAGAVANIRQIVTAYGVERERNHIVSWLPLFHDMGLVLSVGIPLVSGAASVITEPLAFVQQPVRWLRMLADRPGAVTAAPNFAYDYCARRVKEEQRADLRLGDVAVLINGSEPIRAETLDRFQQAFGACGARPEMMRPAYGLAEATVFVSTTRNGTAPRVTAFDRELLGQGTLSPAPPAAGSGTFTELVACGGPVGQEVAVVDPANSRRLPDGSVGEIWVHGPNVARGYWRSPSRSAEIFAAALADEPSGGASGGASSTGAESGGARRWMRTGDLGAVHDGDLYVTGRIKDLIIVDGTNHYPQDIETTVQEAHALIRYDHVAAFALTVDGTERLVIVAEHSRHADDPETEREAVGRAVRDAVVAGHGAPVHDFVLAPPGTVPRTSSGKVARSACRRDYLAGTWSEPADLDRAGAGGAE
ncbi:fatty acyl-AMP ligase [Streptomyces sp. NPDC047108]|uniref:fatty acyl-AMP ligase n=1 Tax=Streptomyces sp. NPDC047108 TaxID=3155025 RepID=UPI003406DBCF